MINLRNIRIITVATLHEELHHKSFWVMLLMAVGFIVLLKGCFENNVMVNGESVSGEAVGWQTSLIAFHIITALGIIIAILTGTKTLRRDDINGTSVMVMSKPVQRIEYFVAKVFGVFILAYGITFILHLTVFVIMLIKTGGRISFFLPASLIISLNILLVTLLVLSLSQLLPDTGAALLSLALWIIGYINDSLFLAVQNETVKQVVSQMSGGETGPGIARVLWLKMAALQYYAVSLIRETPFVAMGGIHPLLVNAVYCCLLFTAGYLLFNRKEIR